MVGVAGALTVWHPVVQWWRMKLHARADPGRVPSWTSVAWPEKLMVSPTAQVRLDVGVSITGVGAVLPPPTVMVIGVLSEEAPLLINAGVGLEVVLEPLLVGAVA